MDKMSIKDILLVGVPDAFIWLIFGIFLCNHDYFKNKKILSSVLKFIISIIIILSIVIYIRTIVTNILYVSIVSALLYAIVFRCIWGFNKRISIFTGILFAFMSSSIENVFTPLFIHLSSYTNIFTQSRFLLSLPIRITEIIIIYIVYISKINLGNIVLFKNDWSKMNLANKISVILLIIFVLTGFIISNSYTDILIKQSVLKIDLSQISFNIHLMFYGVVLLIFSGILIISRTRKYEEIKQEVKDIKDAFNIPKEKLFLNFLQSSNSEDITKYKEIFTNYVKEVKINEK